MNYEYDDLQRALEAREAADSYAGAPDEELHTWQASVTFGPCSEEDAAVVFRDLIERARFGPSFGSYGLEQIDG